MNQPLFHKLTTEAASIMANSNDPVHDLSHVRRVVSYTKRLCADMNISGEQTEALILASWWHDASRTLTKKPSVIWMPMVDDMLSALMLWIATIRAGFFGNVPGLACRIILCKSFGTGALFSRILIRKKNRILIDIVDDADNLDILHQARIHSMMNMVEDSWVYKHGYKFIVSWLLRTSQIHMKTKAAKTYFVDIFKRFILFLKESHTYAWHVAQFGKVWTDKSIAKAEQVLALFIRNITPAVA